MRLPGCKVRSVVSQIRTIYGETSVPGDKWLSRVCQWDGDTDKDYYRAQGWRHRYNVGVMSIVWCEDTKIDRKQNQVQHSTRRHHSLLCGDGWSRRGLAVVRNATLNFPVFIQPGIRHQQARCRRSAVSAQLWQIRCLGVLQSHINTEHLHS